MASSIKPRNRQVATKLWGITDGELKAIHEALAESGRGKRKAANDGDKE